MRVLVCGGRDYSDDIAMNRALFPLIERGLSVVMQGGARGMDTCARQWALAMAIPVETYRPDWSLGRAAGPIRNQRMLDEGKPDLVVAFPGGRGTADMVAKAKAADVPVEIVE